MNWKNSGEYKILLTQLFFNTLSLKQSFYLPKNKLIKIGYMSPVKKEDMLHPTHSETLVKRM